VANGQLFLQIAYLGVSGAVVEAFRASFVSVAASAATAASVSTVVSASAASMAASESTEASSVAASTSAAVAASSQATRIVCPDLGGAAVVDAALLGLLLSGQGHGQHGQSAYLAQKLQN